MSNLYKSTKEILKVYRLTYSLTHTLKDVDNYWGHTSTNKSEELLEQHLLFVEKYLLKLIEVHDLDEIIDRLIFRYLSQFDFNDRLLGDFLKKVFVYTICYHDHGKINYQFQGSERKLNNPNFQDQELNTESSLGTNHSLLSAFIFIAHMIKACDAEFQDKESDITFLFIVLLSYPILKHHSSQLKDTSISDLAHASKVFPELHEYLSKFKDDFDYGDILYDLNDLEYLLGLEGNFNQYSKYANSFALYQLLRLNFSLLTASDYLATNEYMSGFPVKDFGVLTNDRIQALYERITEKEWINEPSNKKNYNKKTYEQLSTLSLENKPQEKSNENLNLLRQQMATEAIRNLRDNISQSLFYLEAPTGGGKTNISMLLALELLKAHPELNKVYYVFPFTTLIDQTFASIKENLGLTAKEIVALHSKASLDNDSNKEDDVYGSNKKNYINRLFVNYPFCLLSHVRFFDVLKTNEKETNYILHRLANSVVVIDELQAYDPQHWDKIIYFIQKYAQCYNIKFIVMSATLPKIGNLEIKGVDKDDIVYLIPNAKKDYFRNPNFSGRIIFDFSLLPDKISLEQLAQRVLNESMQYAEVDGGTTKPLGSVYTIVEFIFKKSATLFKKEIDYIHKGFFDEILILSGNILHHRRRHIINFLKRKDNRTKKVLLITTQVVEAGVDIDMDLGFKDTSLIDSDEQLAGRINRNVNKKNCKLFLFNYNKAGIIHQDDLRYALGKELNLEDKAYILETKDFDFLYQKVIQKKNERNHDANFVGINDYLEFINQLQFQSVNQNFKLIEQENYS
ncbi:MAG: CRISPR-associated helicase Cas3', partial [Weeksellaceae bacterium]